MIAGNLKVFTIFGNPIPWKRSGQHGKKHYDEQKKIKESYVLMIKPQLHSNFVPYSKGIDVRFEFLMPIPSSYSKKKKEELDGKFHVKKPDLSNLVKFVEDTFNGILWEDDSLICYTFSSKRYCSEPKTLILINESGTW